MTPSTGSRPIARPRQLHTLGEYNVRPRSVELATLRGIPRHVWLEELGALVVGFFFGVALCAIVLILAYGGLGQ